MTATRDNDPFASGALGGLGDLLGAARARLSAAEVEATAGGGAVSVTMDGERRLKSISIAPEAMEGEPAELEELILAAVNEAWEKANAAKSSALSGLLPGLGDVR